MDWIEGSVLQVVDGDTFDVRVEWVGRANTRTYNASERVRLQGVNAPELNSLGGQEAKQRLRSKLEGQYVRCFIQARDVYHRLVCDVQTVARRATA